MGSMRQLATMIRHVSATQGHGNGDAEFDGSPLPVDEEQLDTVACCEAELADDVRD